MTYNQFIRTVENRVREGFENNIEVCTHAVLKNNGTIRQGILFKETGINISPTIYLEEYYQRMLGGESIEEIVKEILRVYRKVRFNESMDADFIQEYSQIKEKIIYRLINRDANEKLLEDVPHGEYLDLAVVYYLLLDVTEYGTASMLIHNSHIQSWGVDARELHQEACKNTGRLLPYEFMTMNAALESLTNIKLSEEEDILYILSNKHKSYGSAAMLYSGCLEGIGMYLKTNYYILPSSIHEVVVISEEDSPGRERLRTMVENVNETQMEEEDILSNHIYYYDREQKKLQIAL